MSTKMEHFPAEKPNPVISVEKDGTVLYSNEVAKPLLNEWGVGVGEKLPLTIGDIVQRVISRNRPEKIEVKVGKRVYLVTFQPLPEEECVNIYGLDISDQIELEMKLRESEKKYRIVADNTSDWDFWLCPDGRFLYMSPSCEQVTGYAAQEFMDNSDLLQKIIHSDDRQAFLQHMHDMPLNRHYDIEFRIVTKDGKIRWIHHLCQPVYDSMECYAGNLCSNRDITKRKQEEYRICRYNHILEGINWIFSNVVQAKTEEELGEACLSVALEVTGSEFGYIIEMGVDGLLHDIAKSKLAWEQCHMYDKTGHICLPHDYAVHGLYGSVIVSGKSFFTNDPQSHPDSTGLPPGHPPIKSFLTVPLTLDGKIVGSIGVGNREGGYSYEQQEDLEAIAPAVSQVLQRRKVEQERKQFEEQIRLRAEELETLMDVAPVSIMIGHDPQCNNITGNQMANELYEVELGENISANVTSTRRYFLQGRELTADELPMQVSSIKDIDVRAEFEVLLPSGEWRAMLGSASPLHDVEGHVRGSVGAFMDITERKKAETKLKETLENLENLVKERTVELEKAYNSLKVSEKSLAEAQKIAHIGNWDLNILTNGLYWSNEIYRIFGSSPQEFGATYDAFLSYVHPEDREYVNNAVLEALKGKSYSIDHRIVLASGEARIVHEQGKVILNEKNIPIRMIGTVQDITERKRVEEKLQESEEKYRNIVETANEGITIISADNIITYANRKIVEMLGYTLEELIGRPIWNFISEESKTISKLNIEKRKQGINESYELKLICKNGLPLWILTNGKALFDNGKYAGSLSLHTDITKRKEAEEALRNFEIANKKELHHRIKNNLQVISSLLDLQADLFKDRKTITDSEVLKAFKQSIDRVLSIALIHEELYKGKNIDLLNFSQYVKELAENLLLTYSLKTDISLNFDLEENIFLDMDTAIPLGIVVNEIVSNSFKYAFSGRDKGEIKIKLHREEEGECKKEGCKSNAYVLSVSDNGVGIPEDLNIEDLDSLGLQLVTSLVDQLDGELELKRDNGTEFTIRFFQ